MPKMDQSLESKIKNLPSNPGIYQFKNEKGKVIYVGKAKNLKNRIKTYFHHEYTDAKTAALVNKIIDFELIVTDNEIEALVLENNLIKELKPRYNVNLKDDKSYPFIKVTNEMFPRIYPTRRIIKDGSKYFGPYTDVKNMKASLRMINQIFKIRSCRLDITPESIEKKKFKVCLDFHIKKCDGPCEGLISRESYNEMVNEVAKVLKGKTDDLIKDLNVKMNSAVENLEFEKAAEIRDRVEQLKVISEKQKVVSEDFIDRDVFGIAFEGRDAACSVFNIRNGKLVGKKQLSLSIEEGEELSGIFSAAVKFYYGDFVEVPKEIIIEVEPPDAETLVEWLNLKTVNLQSGKTGKTKFVVPQRGSLKSLLKMCRENALLQLKDIQLQRMKHEGLIPYSVAALQRDLRMSILPRKIECFDISNIQGSDTVASMVVFVDGKPKKSLYRKYIINDVAGPDDFSSMREVIRRRYTRINEEGMQLPDLIMVDGGKGQLSSAVEVLDELNIKNCSIIGLAKRLEEVFIPYKSEPISISKTSSGIKLLQRVRDEAHRFALTFHRNRRTKRTIQTELTEIKGVGENTAYKLLLNLGSVSAVKNSTYEDLLKLVGKRKAEILIKHFSNNK